MDGSSVDGKSFVSDVFKSFGILCLSVSKVEVLKGSMEGKHIFITCTLTVKNQAIPTYALIECGATGIAFMDQDYAHQHQIPVQQLKKKRQVEVIDGRPIQSGDITHIAIIRMAIYNQKEKLPMFVTKLGHYPTVFRIPWLQLHDVVVRFASYTVPFGSQYCTTHCHDAPVTVQGGIEEPPEHVIPPGLIIEQQILPPPQFRRDLVILN